MGKQAEKSTHAALFEPQKAVDQAIKELTDATKTDAILNALARIQWIKAHKTECPQSAIPTVDGIVTFMKDPKPVLIESKKEEDLTYDDFATHPFIIESLFSLFIERGQDLATVIANMHKQWRTIDGAKHPLAGFIEVWQTWQTTRPRNIETVSTTQTKGLVRLPYRTSEVLRRNWRPLETEVQAVLVDGEPLVAKITDVTSPSKDKQVRIYTSNGQGQMALAISTQRQPDQKPVPLIAFENFSDDLRSPIATDVAILMTVAHAGNQDIQLTSQEGARFLARGRDGKARRIFEVDKQRFENAFAALHGMSAWVLCPDNIRRLFPLIKTDRINNETVVIGPPTWAKNEQGLYTLSGAFGKESATRLIGQANDGGLWRTIVGIEYWLARSPARWHKGRMRGLARRYCQHPARPARGNGKQ